MKTITPSNSWPEVPYETSHISKNENPSRVALFLILAGFLLSILTAKSPSATNKQVPSNGFKIAQTK